MKKHYALPILGLFLGTIFLSLAPIYPSYNPPPQNTRPGVSNENDEIQHSRQGTGREEIAYVDERDIDIHERADRKGDWNYRQNWRYDRQAFYSGETQADAYDREHPDGVGGPGLDADTEFLEMRKYYMENQGKNRQQPTHNQSNTRRYGG